MPQQLSLNLGLDIAPISTDQDNLPDLLRLYNACKLLASQIDDFTGALGADPSLWSVSGSTRIVTQNGARLYVIASENLVSGNVVTLYNNAGILTCKKSGGSIWQGDSKGFVIANVTSGNYAEVFLIGVCNAITGLVPGSVYYTSDSSAGLISGTPGASPHKQAVGFALSSSTLWFNPALYSV